MSEQKENNTTHFGFQDVPVEEKVKRVADVFHSVAGKYDLMNDLMSGGIHRLWKRITVDQSGVKRGHKVLDIAGGTGDLTLKFARMVGQEGKVILADINDSMLKVGRDKLINSGVGGNVEYVQANAECLPFKDNTFDVITIAFGLRNVTDQNAAIASMLRVLKPGGKLMILEFSRTNNPVFTKLYDFYSFNILPQMGKVIAGDAESYRYLAESIRKHPDQETLKGMMEQAGFVNCRYQNMTGGVVALHTGIKP
jgi:demethylmenaquinone methyltransferase/2-methoxy-6-polyprenyl-1,4-benzoquinol methylase